MSRLPTEKRVDSPKDEHVKSVDEIASDGIRGVDEPMEKAHPEGSAMLVFATYPILLIVGLIVVLGALWLWRSV